ncbi:hypothetical protein ACIBLA_35760 [Streptomyces sp. NPDC050433]|uniref:hypothetical protein n=1 Tax=Streptomyces sp. NPDC050433 TaxID=3365615 RepID=UPI0037A68606
MTEQRLPGMPAERVHIPSLCWVPRPGTAQRCTEHAGHDGQHFDCYTRDEWPHCAGEAQ